MSETSEVVLFVDSHERSARCLSALRRHSAGSRIVVVDDNLQQAPPTWLDAIGDLEVLDGMGAGLASAYNIGLQATDSEVVGLVSTDVLVSRDWNCLLAEALASDPAIAVVGPVAQGLAGQAVATTYPDLDDFELFSRAYNHCDPAKWSPVLRLSTSCTVVRRRALDAVGGFDESFSLGTLIGDDLSLRLVGDGSRLLRCGDVLVHYFGERAGSPDEERFLALEIEGFRARWGFAPGEMLQAHDEVVGLLGAGGPLSLLELGCGGGATLLEVARRFPGSSLHGVEHDASAALIASALTGAQVSGEVDTALEKLEEKSLDYVISAGFLERQPDPSQLLKHLLAYLEPGGKIVARVANVMHASILAELLRGRFSAAQTGHLDGAQLRFFTLADLDAMLERAGYGTRQYYPQVQASEADVLFANTFASSFSVDPMQYLATHYLAVAGR